MLIQKTRTADPCDDCGGEDFNHRIVIDFTLSKEPIIAVVLCQPCRVKLTNKLVRRG